MTSPTAQRVIELLSPTVGDFLAKAKVQAACKLAKLDVEKLAHNDLPTFAEKLALTCENMGPAVTQELKKRVLLL